MNFKIIEKALLPLFLATIFIVAFHWQFIKIYAYFIEHFTQEKLSTLYAHLFIYSFLSFTLFLFFMNLVNQFLKSKLFIIIITLMLLTFYGLSYETFYDPIKYFMNYPLTINGLMAMVLFLVSTLMYTLYSLFITLFNKFIPLSHSLIFLSISLAYSAWFINFYCYPISTILTQFNHI